MAVIERFEDLRVWRESLSLDKDLTDIFTVQLLKYDLGFRQQVLNSSGSCMDNIAEGFERGGNKEFMNFLRIAKASIAETRSQIHRAESRGYIDSERKEVLVERCVGLGRGIGAFIKYLKDSGMKGERYVQEPEGIYELNRKPEDPEKDKNNL